MESQAGTPPFFAHYALPTAHKDDVVKVDIDGDANVLLVDQAAFEAYQAHQTFHYVGGGYHAGTHHLGVPGEGSWHLVIDLGGRAGAVHHSVVVHHEARGVATEQQRSAHQSHPPAHGHLPQQKHR
jgi:hypothetical protein